MNAKEFLIKKREICKLFVGTCQKCPFCNMVCQITEKSSDESIDKMISICESYEFKCPSCGHKKVDADKVAVVALAKYNSKVSIWSEAEVYFIKSVKEAIEEALK